MLCPQLASAKYIDTWIKFIITIIIIYKKSHCISNLRVGKASEIIINDLFL